MSTEQVLLIVFLLVIPLIQFLVRLARQGNELPEQAGSLPPSARRPPEPELEPPPATEDRTLSDAMTAPERKPEQNADRAVAPAIRRTARRGAAVVGLYDPLGLRRAVVLMTVLEPCRAIRPHDSPEPAGRR